MDDRTIKNALAAVGRVLPAGIEIEILVVGGAAIVLTGELHGDFATSDVDTMEVVPWQAREPLQDAAAKVGVKLGLSPQWLDMDNPGLKREALPEDWKDRRVDSGRYGELQVWSAGRLI
jgi:hypothetical protein